MDENGDEAVSVEKRVDIIAKIQSFWAAVRYCKEPHWRALIDTQVANCRRKETVGTFL